MSLASLALLSLAVAVPVGSAATQETTASPAVQVTLTTTNLRRALSGMPTLRFQDKLPRLPLIGVHSAVRYQRVRGFGAAMTDSSAWLLYRELPRAARLRVMRDLFGPSGIDLDFVRIPMAASDFTATGVPYSYDDLPTGQTDPLLKSFSVAHDDAYIVPVLRAMLQINPKIFTLANPWTAPPWMKANDAFNSLVDSLGDGALLPDDYQPFADYFLRFIRAFAARGIPIDAITPQNEPTGPAPFPGMYLDEPAEATFISRYLAPTLGAAGLHPSIYGLDDSGRNLPYAAALLSGPARSALSGIAWHCYAGMDALSALHQDFPSVDQLVSECSPGIIPDAVVEVAIDAMRNWASTAALWNLALDPAGGPVEPPNLGCGGCSGMVTVSERTHRATYGLNYYQFGQVSKFVEPGAVRIASPRFVSDYQTGTGAYGVTPGLDNVAFLNPNGVKVVVVYNDSRIPRAFAIGWHKKYITYALAPFATATFQWR